MLIRSVPNLASGFLWVVACTAVAGAAAAEGETLVLTPGEAVDLALESHPALLGERERLRENRHLVREAFSAAWPQVDGKVSAVRNRDPGFLNTPDIDRFIDQFPPEFIQPIPVTTYDYRIGVEQILYAFGKVGKGIEAARVNRERARYEVLDREMLIGRDAVLACYGLARAEARLEVLVAERISLERQLRQARDFLEIGTGTRLQVLQASAALSALRPRELGAMGDVETARIRLNEAVGRAPREPVEVAPGILENAILPEIPPAADLISQSERRPDLQALGEHRQVLDLLRQIEGTNRLPEVRFSGSYGYRAIETENLFRGNYKSWDAGLYLDWKLFDGKRTRSKVRQIESQKQQNLWAARARQAQIARDLVAAVERYRQAREAASAAREAIGQAEEAHRVAEESRRWGAATVLDVLEAERTLSGARFQRLEAVHDALGALAEIHYQVGRLPMEPLVDAGESP
jgi:multidrug efflux system outer membrane protein